MPTTLPIDMITIYGLEMGERRFTESEKLHFRHFHSGEWTRSTKHFLGGLSSRRFRDICVPSLAHAIAL
jgi:hypothetical protein